MSGKKRIDLDDVFGFLHRVEALSSESATPADFVSLLEDGASLFGMRRRSAWRDVLGPCATKAEARAAYRAKALTAHPDRGGSTEAMVRLRAALEAALEDLPDG